jgi:hypothetical protein
MKPTKALGKPFIRSTTAIAVFALSCVLCIEATSAQSAEPESKQFASLGQLLSAGGKLLPPGAFKEEVVQRVLVGTLPSGSMVEVMYTSSGALAGNLIQGAGNAGGINFGRKGAPQNWPVSGSWTTDDSERICTTLQITGSQASTIIPTRCEFWFKLGDIYYVCDSDEDRSAKLAVRALKQ